MQSLLDLIDAEIAFHADYEESPIWSLLCKLTRRREPNDILIRELTFLKMYGENQQNRTCMDCSGSFEPADAIDWWCKGCLLKRYQSLRPHHEPTSSVKEPEMTPNSPGGS